MISNLPVIAQKTMRTQVAPTQSELDWFDGCRPQVGWGVAAFGDIYKSVVKAFGLLCRNPVFVVGAPYPADQAALRCTKKLFAPLE